MWFDPLQLHILVLEGGVYSLSAASGKDNHILGFEMTGAEHPIIAADWAPSLNRVLSGRRCCHSQACTAYGAAKRGGLVELSPRLWEMLCSVDLHDGAGAPKHQF